MKRCFEAALKEMLLMEDRGNYVATQLN